MTARRSTRLLLLPVVLLLLAPLAILGGPRGAIAGAAITTYWLVSAIADYSKQLEISDGQIKMRGYIGGALTVRSADAVSCTYVKYRARERGTELFFLEIRDVQGTRIQIWRYGWGRNRRSIFQTLERWLADTPAVVSADARRILEAQAA